MFAEIGLIKVFDKKLKQRCKKQDKTVINSLWRYIQLYTKFVASSNYCNNMQ